MYAVCTMCSVCVACVVCGNYICIVYLICVHALFYVLRVCCLHIMCTQFVYYRIDGCRFFGTSTYIYVDIFKLSLIIIRFILCFVMYLFLSKDFRALETFIRSKYEQKIYIAHEWVPVKPVVPKEVSLMCHVLFHHMLSNR